MAAVNSANVCCMEYTGCMALHIAGTGPPGGSLGLYTRVETEAGER